MKISSGNQTGNEVKLGVKDKLIATAASCSAGSAAISAVGLSTPAILFAMNKIGKLPNDKVELLHKTAQRALDITGLADKGVTIQYLKNEGAKKPIWQLIRSSTNAKEQIKQGYNAGFVAGGKILGIFFGNKVLMPEKDIAFAAFHEIGHAINFNNSNFWKKMQKLRTPCMALALLPMTYGMLTHKSVAKDGKELTKKQKLNNFIRDNAGKLSFATMIPVLAEEGMASIRGQKLANQLLDSKMARHVLKGNAVAYMSYIAVAASLAAGAYTAVKVKDYLMGKFAEKSQKKQEEKMLAESMKANSDIIQEQE